MITRTRGYLPHFDTTHGTYFVTFRLFDSRPRSVLLKLRKELEHNLKCDAPNRLKYLDRYELKVQHYLDSSYGECFLQNPSIARLVIETLQKYDGQWYVCHAYTIMPNHVHVLFWLNGAKPLSEVIRNWKGVFLFCKQTCKPQRSFLAT